MAYLNLMAEYEFSEINIITLAGYANVTVDVMQDVLDGNDELSFDEALGLVALFGQCGIPNDQDFGFEYLFGNRYKWIETQNTALLESIDRCKRLAKTRVLDSEHKNELLRIERMTAKIKQRPIILYAEYRHLMGSILYIESYLTIPEPRNKAFKGIDPDNAAC